MQYTMETNPSLKAKACISLLDEALSGRRYGRVDLVQKTLCSLA